MRFEPYDYQRHAIDFIKGRPFSALLLDMGLGKTAITLAAFNELRSEGKARRLLVVAPKRVAEITWPEELATWDELAGLRMSLIAGTEAKRRKAAEAEADVYIVSRDNIVWLNKSGACPGCDMLAIDEMQSFKSRDSQRTQAMVALRERFSRIVGLSGTPAPNGWLDLWSQYRILDGGMSLGASYWPFVNKHFVPGKKIVRFGKERTISYRLIAGHERVLEDAIAPITLSMRAVDHLDLPDVTYSHAYAKMTDEETESYRMFAQSLEGYFGGEKLKVPTDEALVNKLVQLAGGVAYGADGKPIEFHRHKLDVLRDLVEEAQGKPMLVAYWFRNDRERIAKELSAMKIPFGEIDSLQTKECWDRGDYAVGLIHPGKAGSGLNLQRGGSIIVWYSLPAWNLELYEQANARLYRNGQKNHVSIVHIMTKDTIDGAMLGLLRKKRKMQNELKKSLSASSLDGNEAKRSVAEELGALFSWEESSSDVDIERALETLCSYVYEPFSEGDAIPGAISFSESSWASDGWGDERDDNMAI